MREVCSETIKSCLVGPGHVLTADDLDGHLLRHMANQRTLANCKGSGHLLKQA